MPPVERVALVDGCSILRPEFAANPDKCVDRFLGRIGQLSRRWAYEVAVFWDVGRNSFRYKLYQDYKKGRSENPPEYNDAMVAVKRQLGQYAAESYENPDYEADDLIATATRQAVERLYQVTICSRDSDLYQLLQSGKVNILRKWPATGHGNAKIEWITASDVGKEKGISPSQWRDFRMLMGDTTDNIPGAKGIGEKTALHLINAHGDIPGIYQAFQTGELEAEPKRVQDALAEFVDQADLMRQLVSLKDDAPFELKLNPLPF